MKKRQPWVSYDEMEIRKFREKPSLALKFLDAAFEVAFEENDPGLILSALSTVARARGMTRLAKQTDLRRESLHRMLAKGGNPEWKSLFRILKALDVRPRLELPRRPTA